MVDSDTTTGKYIVGGTGKNAVPLSNNNKKSMTFVDTENESADEDYFQPQKRLQTYSSHSQYDWSLWEDMVSCTLKQFHSFITGAELEDRILYQNPIPSNLPPPLPLDQFLKGVLEENHKYSQMQEDIFLRKNAAEVESYVTKNVLSLMSQIWQKIEVSTQRKTDSVEIDLCEFKELTEQSIMMLGQVFHNITYNRCLHIFNALMKEHESKQMLREKASIFFESHKELLGQNFREDWCTILKTR